MCDAVVGLYGSLHSLARNVIRFISAEVSVSMLYSVIMSVLCLIDLNGTDTRSLCLHRLPTARVHM